MGPGLGVAYAMQKVFSGKSPAYSTWLKEFIMNTFIQSVHAILYAIFVSQALILSLDSLAGMIIALVFLNFALKADKLFRKIFKMGEGESLLGRTADAGDPDNMKQPFNAVKTFMKADATKQVAKTLVNTPYAKAIKGAGKVAVAGAATAATGLIMGAEKAKEVPGDIRSGMESLGESFERGIDRRLAIADQKGDNGIPVRVLRKIKGGLTKRKLDKNVANAADEVKNAETPGEKLAAMDKHNRATQKRDRVNNVVEQPNFVKIGVTRLTRSIDVRNTFNVSRSQSFGENAAAIYRGIFGTKSVNPKTGKLVSDKNGIYSKLSLSQVMGLEDKDKKALKQFTKFASSGLLGMAGMFVGMGTMVANPKIGLAMLTHGAYQTNRVFGLRAPNMQDYRNKKFTFGRFSEGALNNMRQTTIGLANQEMQAIGNGKLSEAVSRISTSEARLSSIESRRARKTIKDRFKTLKGSLKGKKSNMPGAISMKSQTLAGALNQGDRAYADAMGGEDGELVFVPKRRRGRYPVTNLGVAYDNMMKTFEKEADENFANVQKDYLQRVKTFEEEGKDIANVQLLLQYNRLKRKSQEKARKEMQGDALKEEYGRMGFVYDPATGKLTRTAATGEKSTDGSVEVKPKISKHDLYVSQTGKKNVNVGIRDTEKVEKINAEFDKAIATVAQGREIDVTDKKVYAQLVEQVSENLRKAGILGEKQEAESLFKKGQLRKNIEAKAEYSNAKVSAVDRFLEVELSKAEVDAVKTALADTLGKDASEVSAEELYDAMRDSVPLTREELEERRDMYREEIQDAGFEIDEKTHQVVEQEREIEPDSELDIYTKHLVEAYALQGLVYDPKTGTVSDDPDKAPEAEKEEEEDGLAPATDGREISDVDRALAHTELDAIIMEMANGDFLDINDEKTMDEILRRLSNRLGKMGILKSDEVVTELFTKASLRREIKYKTKKANTKIEASKKYLEEALSEEEVSSVMSAIESLSEKSEEGTIITIEDVSREMSAQGTGFKDGPAGPTGPTNPDADPRGPEAPVLTADEKKAVVEQYLSGMQEEVEKAEKVRNASERAEARVSEKVESDKIDKVPTLEKYLETRMAEDKLVEEEPQSSTKKKIDQIVQSGLEGYAEDKRGNRLLDFLASAEALMETGGEIETGDGSKVLLNPDEMAETRETLVIVEEMLSANRKQREKSEKKKYLPSISTLEAELNARREENLYESLVKSKGEGSREAVEAKEKMEAKKVAQEIAKKKDGLKADIAGPVFDIQSIVLNEKIAKKNKQRIQEVGSEDIRRKRPGTKRPGKKA